MTGQCLPVRVEEKRWIPTGTTLSALSRLQVEIHATRMLCKVGLVIKGGGAVSVVGLSVVLLFSVCFTSSLADACSILCNALAVLSSKMVSSEMDSAVLL